MSKKSIIDDGFAAHVRGKRHDPAVVSHLSHGLGDAITGHTHPAKFGKRRRAKRLTAIRYHDGQHTRTASGGVTLGGNHRSAIDSLTGQAVIPGAVKFNSRIWKCGTFERIADG